MKLAFSLYKTDEDISAYLAGKLSQPVLNALLENLSFDKFIQLSLKALWGSDNICIERNKKIWLEKMR